jgi:methyl-accepting chemotaxis protein
MSGDAARALNEIVAESRTIHTVIGEIASNSQSQNENIRQITGSLTNIGGISVKIAAEAEKTHLVAQQLSERSASLEEVIGGLHALVGSRN